MCGRVGKIIAELDISTWMKRTVIAMERVLASSKGDEFQGQGHASQSGQERLNLVMQIEQRVGGMDHGGVEALRRGRGGCE